MSEIKAGARVRIELEIIIPVDASRDEIEHWVCFSTGANGTINSANPLLDHDLNGVAPVQLTLVTP